MNKYVCVDYMCCLQTKLRFTIKVKGFKKITYNYVSGIGIP